MRVGYSKLGRSWRLDERRASAIGGDMDVIRMLKRLARRRPDDTFVLVGKNSGENPQSLGYPPNVVNPWQKGAGALKLPRVEYTVNPYRCALSESRELYEEMTAEAMRLMHGTIGPIDAHVMWLGQHSIQSSPLPKDKTDWADRDFTKPLVSGISHAAYLLEYVRSSKVEPVAVCPDARNTLRAAEITMTQPVIANYDLDPNVKAEQYQQWNNDDTPIAAHLPGRRVGSKWKYVLPHRYGGIELSVGDAPEDAPPRIMGGVPFGLIVNEARIGGPHGRLRAVMDWARVADPDVHVYGEWRPESIAELAAAGVHVRDPIPVHKMMPVLCDFRATLMTPSSGSGWATAKPWECFAAGTVCFFHPRYDDQGHILPIVETKPYHTDQDLWLSEFLRPKTPDELRRRLQIVQNPLDHRRVIDAQWDMFQRAFDYYRGCTRTVQERIWGDAV